MTNKSGKELKMIFLQFH